MIISFDSRNLLECCSTLEAAEQRLGSAYAQALLSLIADAESFENAAELIEFFGPAAHVGDGDTISIAIGSDYRIEFVAAGTRFRRKAEGEIAWTSVQRLKLVNLLRCT